MVKIFGEYVNCVVFCPDILIRVRFCVNKFPNEIVSNVDVLCAVYEEKAELEFLGTRATHYRDDGELNGIAQALEGAREVNMLAIL